MFIFGAGIFLGFCSAAGVVLVLVLVLVLVVSVLVLVFFCGFRVIFNFCLFIFGVLVTDEKVLMSRTPKPEPKA